MSKTNPPEPEPSIRDRRRAARLTVIQLAGKAAVSPSFVSQVEAGYLPRNSAALRRIVSALDLVDQEDESDE